MDILEDAIKKAQECISHLPVIILGSGHSCAYNIPGMDELACYLTKEIPLDLSTEDKPMWASFESKIKTKTLENVLQELDLNKSITDKIIRRTWACIKPADYKVFLNTVENNNKLALTKLYKYMFNSTHQRIQIVTTNYDCIAEYAADIAGFAWCTGFSYGYIGNAYNSCCLSMYKGSLPFRTVDIWKVHGSINWYRLIDGSVYFLPAMEAPLSSYMPVMVTPGIDKYRRTHEEPFRSIITGADKAIEEGKSYLCVGYGFNDEHIQPKLVNRCKKDDKFIMVLARKLTDSSRSLLLTGQCKKFVAFEKSDKGTIMYSPEHLKGIEIENENLWSLDELIQKI